MAEKEIRDMKWVLLIVLANGSGEPTQVRVKMEGRACIAVERLINSAESPDTHTMAAWCYREPEQ